MKAIIFNCFSLLLITFIQSQLSEKERRILFEKLYKRNNLNQNPNVIYQDKASNYDSSKYDPIKIKEIIEKYNFPENYNFIEDVKPPVRIKNQKNCGCCWAFSSTTAFSYRYYKKTGIDIDLSPQYLLSCFSGNCSEGGFLIDTQFLLIKNGSITETCMPYTSGNGSYVEECPSKCKNDEEFIKYRAKNAYHTTFDFQNNYYDVVAMMIDQLINYGPIVSSIKIYWDFLLNRGSNCKYQIYRYDGFSFYDGNHAVVIIGYGHQDSKYYWIIQNSWGESFCDKGFAKIEFGEINIENVAFSEPYIEEEYSSGKEISVKLKLNEDCKYEYIIENNDYNESFELYFEGLEGNKSEFYYQCNKVNFLNNTKGICNFNLESYNNNEKGFYQYKQYKSLLKNNLFNIEFSSVSEKQFYYYQNDIIDRVYTEINDYYISEEGSQILLSYVPFSKEENELRTNVYTNKETLKKINNCKKIRLNGNYYVFCNISQDEIKYFDNENRTLPLIYDILCNKKKEMNLTVHQLDKTKYPIFRVTQFILPNSSHLYDYSEFILIANIEGNISKFKEEIYYFSVFILIKRFVQFLHEELLCQIQNITEIQNNFEISCNIWRYWYPFNPEYLEITLEPYYIPVTGTTPFEVIINNNIIGITYNEYLYNLTHNNSEFQNDTISEFQNDTISESTNEIKTENPSSNKAHFVKFLMNYIFIIIFIIY